MSDTEATNAAATNEANTEEEKKHDVDYADEESKNAVSTNPARDQAWANMHTIQTPYGQLPNFKSKSLFVPSEFACFDALIFGLFFCLVWWWLKE